jgi:hypothetical protein
MSDDTDKRLTTVELRLDGIERDMGKVVSGMNRLLEQQAAQPQALTWKTVLGTLASVLGGAAIVWQIVGMSPSVTDLQKEMAAIKPIVKRNDDALMWRPTAWTAEVRKAN